MPDNTFALSRVFSFNVFWRVMKFSGIMKTGNTSGYLKMQCISLKRSRYIPKQNHTQLHNADIIKHNSIRLHLILAKYVHLEAIP